jgi:hypothetical protein
VNGLKHQKEKRSMDHFAGLDVSVKETSVCIVDDTGKIVREVKVASEPEALLAVLKNPAYHFKRIGLEAGPLSQWLFSSRRSRVTGGLCRDTAHAGGAEGADQQDGPQRCARHRADDAGRALPPCLRLCGPPVAYHACLTACGTSCKCNAGDAPEKNLTAR